ETHVRTAGDLQVQYRYYRVRADEIAAAGVTISNEVVFLAVLRSNAALPIGTVFTLIENTAAVAISGTFSNLPDGSSFTAGNNTFQASYEGSAGKHRTLTVEPYRKRASAI